MRFKINYIYFWLIFEFHICFKLTRSYEVVERKRLGGVFMIMFRHENFNASSEASKVYVDSVKRGGAPIGPKGILGMGFLLV